MTRRKESLFEDIDVDDLTYALTLYADGMALHKAAREAGCVSATNIRKRYGDIYRKLKPVHDTARRECDPNTLPKYTGAHPKPLIPKSHCSGCGQALGGGVKHGMCQKCYYRDWGKRKALSERCCRTPDGKRLKAPRPNHVRCTVCTILVGPDHSTKIGDVNERGECSWCSKYRSRSTDRARSVPS